MYFLRDIFVFPIQLLSRFEFWFNKTKSKSALNIFLSPSAGDTPESPPLPPPADENFDDEDLPDVPGEEDDDEDDEDDDRDEHVDEIKEEAEKKIPEPNPEGALTS